MANYKEWIKYKNSKTQEKKKNKLSLILKIIFSILLFFLIKDIISTAKVNFTKLLITSFPNTFFINNHFTAYGEWLDLFLSATIILFIYNMHFTKKQKIKEIINIRRDFKGLLEPVLSETIIDGSLDMKKMIMSIIIQLKLKGNIEIIDNENILLIHEYNLEKYEEKLIKLFFKNKQVISFKDINNLFDEKSIKETTENIYNIKTNILQELSFRELFNNKYIENAATIKSLAYLIIANLPILYPIILLIISLISYKNESITVLLGYFLYNVILFCFVYKATLSNSKFLELYTAKGDFMKSIKGRIFFENLPIILNIIGLIIYYNLNKLLAIEYILILILNVLIIKKKNILILSKKGIQEQIKLLELKKYIEDYSLLSDKNLTAVNLWNEYLAYATAFGIPNTIINKIYELWYNLNIVIHYFK